MRQIAGYALMRRATDLVTWWNRCWGSTADGRRFLSEYLPLLRAALPFVDPARYRGISRQPLMPSMSVDPPAETAVRMSGLSEDLQAAIIAAHAPHRRARDRFREIIGDDTVLAVFEGSSEGEEYDEDLLPTLAGALDVFSLLEPPHDYEIVTLARERFGCPATVLGFDVGYWGGDHFSLICDTAVMPLIQPPDERDFDGLARHLRFLNENVLFSTAAQAEDFRSYYTSRPWAEEETPDSRFFVVEVGLPPVRAESSAANVTSS